MLLTSSKQSFAFSINRPYGAQLSSFAQYRDAASATSFLLLLLSERKGTKLCKEVKSACRCLAARLLAAARPTPPRQEVAQLAITAAELVGQKGKTSSSVCLLSRLFSFFLLLSFLFFLLSFFFLFFSFICLFYE